MKKRNREAQDGLTLIEVTVALTLLSVGVLALAGSMGSMILGGHDRTEEIRKSIQITNLLSSINETDFDQIEFNFGPGSGQDQFWADSAGRIWFIQPAIPMATGTIEFFTEEATVPLASMNGMPGLDLNANGVIDVGPVTDYMVLPMRVTLTHNDPTVPGEVCEFLLRP